MTSSLPCGEVSDNGNVCSKLKTHNDSKNPYGLIHIASDSNGVAIEVWKSSAIHS